MNGKECSDRKCQEELRECHQEVFGVEGGEGLAARVMRVEGNQERRTSIINSKMPKSWLWTIIALVAPVTGIALTILISQATADARFADKVMVIKHDTEISSLKKSVDARIEADKKSLEMLAEILKEVRDK